MIYWHRFYCLNTHTPPSTLVCPSTLGSPPHRRMTALHLPAFPPIYQEEELLLGPDGEKQSPPRARPDSGSSPSPCQLTEQGTGLAEQELVGSNVAKPKKSKRFPNNSVPLVCSHIVALAVSSLSLRKRSREEHSGSVLSRAVPKSLIGCGQPRAWAWLGM